MCIRDRRYLREHFVQIFDLPGLADLSIDLADPEMGSVQINSVTVRKPSWCGTYFRAVPIRVTAVPSPGYRFLRWQGSASSAAASRIRLSLERDHDLRPVFEPRTERGQKVIFNEINYYSAADFPAGDWVELYNDSQQEVDLSDWIFRDSDGNSVFRIAEEVKLTEEGYLVLCRDSLAFQRLYPGVRSAGDFPFGLDRDGELLVLTDASGITVDSLVYGSEPPWPTSPNGKGTTLSLIHPGYDRNQPQSWAPSKGHGTPGRANDVLVRVAERAEAPGDFALFQNYPNPFNPLTRIRYQLPLTVHVNLAIIDVRGAIVRILKDRIQQPGIYEVIWDGVNEEGNRAASGLYFARIRAGRSMAVIKLVLMR